MPSWGKIAGGAAAAGVLAGYPEDDAEAVVSLQNLGKGQPLAKAMSLERRGLTPQEIYEATAWFHSPASINENFVPKQGKWAQQLNDWEGSQNKIQFVGVDGLKFPLLSELDPRFKSKDWSNVIHYPITEVTDRPELFDRFPALKKIRVVPYSGAGAFFHASESANPADWRIGLGTIDVGLMPKWWGLNDEQIQSSVLTHELDHALMRHQDPEEFRAASFGPKFRYLDRPDEVRARSQQVLASGKVDPTTSPQVLQQMLMKDAVVERAKPRMFPTKKALAAAGALAAGSAGAADMSHKPVANQRGTNPQAGWDYGSALVSGVLGQVVDTAQGVLSLSRAAMGDTDDLAGKDLYGGSRRMQQAMGGDPDSGASELGALHSMLLPYPR